MNSPEVERPFQIAVVSKYWRHAGPRCLPSPIRAVLGAFYGEQTSVGREGPPLTAEEAKVKLSEVNKDPNRKGYIIPSGELGDETLHVIWSFEANKGTH